MTAETTFFKSPYYEKKSLFMSYASNTDSYFRSANYLQVTYTFSLCTTYMHSRVSAHTLFRARGKKSTKTQPLPHLEIWAK